MTKRLRWGLLSTARINRSLIPGIRASERSELVAVASRSLERARSYAEEWDVPRALGSYAELIDDPGVDAVYLPLPNHLHAEWTVRAARAGKHVLCEKPLALSVEEVDAVAAAAAENGVAVAEAFMYRHHAQTHRVKSLVDSGALGELRLIRGGFSFVLTREDDVRLDPAMGGGSLWDVGCYPLSFARLLAGAEPREVFGWQKLGPTGVDLVFAGQLRFPGEVLAQIDCGFAAPFRTPIEVVGSEGVLRVARSFKPGPREVLELWRGESLEEVVVEGAEELYLGEVADLEAIALDGAAPALSLSDSRGNVAAITALLRSAREGRTVSLV
jgi:predicted dehydrogenase